MHMELFDVVSDRVIQDDLVSLHLLTPIERQREFVFFFEKYDLDRSLCNLNVDISKSPFDLGVDRVDTIRVSSSNIPLSALGALLNIKVCNRAGLEIFFKMRPSTIMRKVMDAYCTRTGVDRASTRWLFDGEPIREEDTPRELGMEDGDCVDVELA